MQEKDYYAAITHYYTTTATNSIAWEAKFTRTNTLNFKCLPEHQERFLLKAEQVYGYKIADAGIMQKPFDGMVLYKAASIFIAIYYTPRATEIYEMPIRTFLKEKYESGEKSLTKKRASEIGKRIFLK